MALYRKYRPATFAEVVGQEQVTKPLSAALDAGRINHAYLFSGPRGCGKTSSARIMARSLNCVEGPTSTPCGVCDSCRSLAPGGPGNLDVTELDAASHNGVEDMRELRDRAYYAPAESRYRIFIIDEAHMISNAGSNALLKVVEEPPEHLIFIFATTEPEKVIGTIRSRTHHYPFRLLTPPAMRGLLERTVAAEGVHVEDSVYPLVIEAGGGSPRDTLSILDQLLAGAGEEGLTYDAARPLLGVTDITLLDDAVSALAAGDKATMFQLVGDVIDAGHEPRRFATDLLDRLRDLLVLQVVPDAFDAGLVDAPADRADALTQQAQKFSSEQLTHLASILNQEIPNLRGATSPRLLLEILCARLLIGAPQAVSPQLSAPQPGAPQGGVPQAGASQSGGGQGGSPQPGQPAGAARGGNTGGPSASAAQTPAAGGAAAPAHAPQDRNSAAAAAKAAAAAAAAARRGREQQGAKSKPGQPAQPAQPNEPAQPAQPAQRVADENTGQAETRTGQENAQPASPSGTRGDSGEELPQGEPSRDEPPVEHLAEEQAAAGQGGSSQEVSGEEVPRGDTTGEATPQAGAPREADPGETTPADTHGETTEVTETAKTTTESAEPAESSEPAEPAGSRAAEETSGRSSEELAETIRENWARVRQEVGAKNKVAEIMLTEARVLGIKDDTLFLGHTTGALAERLNAASNNDPIVQVLKDNFGAQLKVKCVIGTDPTAVGLSAPREPKPAWNPHKQESNDDSDEESERAGTPSGSETPERPGATEQRDMPASPKPAEKPENSERPENPGNTGNTGNVKGWASDDGWGEPRQIGGFPSEASESGDASAAIGAAQAGASDIPRNERSGLHSGVHRGDDESASQDSERDSAHPTDGNGASVTEDARSHNAAPAPKKHTSPSRNDWQARIAQAQQVAEKRDQAARGATFSNGVPLPPEPGPEEGVNEPPPDPENDAAAVASPSAGSAGYPGQAGNAQGGAGDAAMSRSEEEQMMAESAAREVGEQDHRSATEVAVELLSRELGARPL